MAFTRQRAMIRLRKKPSRLTKSITDDWPEEVPITAAEVDVLEIFLGDMLDAFLRPRH